MPKLLFLSPCATSHIEVSSHPQCVITPLLLPSRHSVSTRTGTWSPSIIKSRRDQMTLTLCYSELLSKVAQIAVVHSSMEMLNWSIELNACKANVKNYIIIWLFCLSNHVDGWIHTDFSFLWNMIGWSTGKVWKQYSGLGIQYVPI